jgi:hypothetical protein
VVQHAGAEDSIDAGSAERQVLGVRLEEHRPRFERRVGQSRLPQHAGHQVQTHDPRPSRRDARVPAPGPAPDVEDSHARRECQRLHALVDEPFRLTLAVALVRLDADPEPVGIRILLLDEARVGAQLLPACVAHACPEKTSLLNTRRGPPRHLAPGVVRGLPFLDTQQPVDGGHADEVTEHWVPARLCPSTPV